MRSAAMSVGRENFWVDFVRIGILNRCREWGKIILSTLQTRNKIRIAVHLVWTTKDRLALITPSLERSIYRCIESEARKLGCVVLALGGMPDHVHLLVLLPTTITVAQLTKQVKGVSSSLARDILGGASHFSWAEGYGAFSLASAHREATIRYILGQKEHHSAQTLWTEFETPREPNT